MKRNHIIFLIIIITLSFAGCSNNNETKDYIYKNIRIKNGQKLIEGKEYEVIYKIGNPIDTQFSLDVYYQQEEINNYTEVVYKFEKIDSVHYTTKIKILPNTSWITMFVYIPYGDEMYRSTMIPIYKNDHQLSFGANIPLLKYADTSTYLKYFYNERQSYPDNLGIYATRWYYELSWRIINKDSVLNQIQYLEANYNKNTALPLLQLIAYTINYDKSKIDIAIKNIHKVKSERALNNWELTSLLNDVLFGNDSLHSDLTKYIREQLILNNPSSFYTSSEIRGGTIWDNKRIDSTIAIDVINKVIEKRPNIIYYNTPKGIILSKYFLPDSLASLNKTLDLLNNALEEYYNGNYELHFSGKDPNYKMFVTRGLIQSIVYNKAIKLKKYDGAINYFKNSLKNFDPTSNNRAMTYDKIGELYLEENNKDSAIKYYYYAYHILPKPHLLEKLNKIMYNNKRIEGEKLIKELEAKYQVPAIYLNEKAPKIVYADNSQVNLLNLSKPKLLIFFNLRCSICKDLMVDYLNSNIDGDDVFVALISPDDINSLKNFKFYELFNTKIIANAFEIIKYFDVGFGAPQYIVISSDNRIISKGDGYMKGSIDWAYLFKRDG
jgi:hypothetical protein